MNQNGFIQQTREKESDPAQLKLFKSRRAARKYIKAVAPNLKVGWAHCILPAYAVIPKGGKK